MSRVLIFGGDGILGSHLYLALRARHQLCVTLHHPAPGYPADLFSGATVVCGVAAGDRARVAAVIDAFKPDWVANAVGLVKRPLAEDRLASLEANTVFPHLLASVCGERGVRLLHFSTDCVYSGRRGFYTEHDVPDNPEWHGRCKALGEPEGGHVLVLRTSFIGLELGCKKSLLEWFLSRTGNVPGYRRAIWSGFPAIELGRIVSMLMESDVPLAGLWHVAMPSITKFELLDRLNERLGRRGVTVVPDDSFVCDRSLDGRAFEQRTGYCPPAWDTLLDEVAEDVVKRWAGPKPSYW